MKGKIVSQVVAVIGIFVVCVTAAYAGGGQGAASLNTFFECQSIDGATVGETVKICEIGDTTCANPTYTNVRVGAGVLACRQVNVMNAVGQFVNKSAFLATDIKCYSVSLKGPKAASLTETLQDNFFSSDTINLSPSVQLLCGPMIPFTQ